MNQVGPLKVFGLPEQSGASMIDDITDLVGQAVVRWRSAGEGGRHSGPPTATVYAATSVFITGDESERSPDWPRYADPTLSILVQRIATQEDGSWICKIDFQFRELAVPYLTIGREFFIMEGPKVAAHARLTSLRDRSRD